MKVNSYAMCKATVKQPARGLQRTVTVSPKFEIKKGGKKLDYFKNYIILPVN